MSKCFAILELFSIFAKTIQVNMSGNAHLDILNDRQTSTDVFGLLTFNNIS